MDMTTDRCFVRNFKVDDIDQFMEYRNDNEWMKYQDFKGYSKDEYVKMLVKEEYDLFSGVQFAITHRIRKVLLGDIYLHFKKNVCWIGYTIHPKYARQGYIYEVVKSLRDWLATKDIDFLKASVQPENVASIHLLEKLEFRENGIKDDGDLIFEYRVKTAI